MLKNTASQKWIVFAFDITDNSAKTGDAAQITANLRIDGAAADAVDDTNPTELEDGYYVFDLTQAETNGDNIVICPASSTGSIQVIGVPGAVWTREIMRGTDSAALASVCTEARLAELAAANLPTDITAIKAETASIQTETTALDTLTKAAGAGDLAAVKAKTDNLPVDPADASDIATAHALLATVAKQDVIDGLVDAIKVVTDNLAASATTLVSGTVSWDATNATTTVIYCSDITEATADHYKGRVIIFTSGALQNQATDITAYALDTGEGKFTVTALTEAPADNVTFVIV